MAYIHTVYEDTH